MLDNQSDEFKFEPNGEYGSGNGGLRGLTRTNMNEAPADTMLSSSDNFTASPQPNDQPSSGYDPHEHIKPRGLRRVD